jgi:hypothetical protein
LTGKQYTGRCPAVIACGKPYWPTRLNKSGVL